jgi:glycogen debranching enzyme
MRLIGWYWQLESGGVQVDRIALKQDGIFVVSDVMAEIPAANSEGFGLYRHDTRFLSTFELRLNGELPVLLNHSVDRAYVATFQMVNPALGDIPRQSLSLRRTRFVHRGLHERIGLQNCHNQPIEVELELRFDADFLDIFEVRGYQPGPRQGRCLPVTNTETGFRFAYSGADGVRRETEVVLHPAPALHRAGRARLPVRLAPQETFIVLVGVLPILGPEEPELNFEFDTSLEALQDLYAAWNHSCTAIRTDNEAIDVGVLWRSQEDLRILCDNFATGLFPTAGVPWFAVPFGRDALVASLQTLALNPDLARGSLGYLAEHQGERLDPAREEEPGKILHEMRFGELANLHQIPHTPYYGSVDSTPLFLVLLVELLNWTADADLFSTLLPNVIAALNWIDRYGDLDEDGLVEYQQHGSLGVRNQGWKDSSDSLVSADSAPAPLPVALVEVQGYVYQAKTGLARVFRHLGRGAEAERLETEAALLKRRFDELFWMPADRFYAQGLDRDKDQVRSISSNPGHCLWSGIVQRRRANQVVRRLLGGDMFSGWGIRTLSSTAVNYNPMSYHNGSVWPHDNSLIAAGMRRYGYRDQAELVSRSVLEACMRFTDARIPELFCGFPRDGRFNSGPGEYLVSCSPQAWGAGSLFHFLQVLAGVEPDMWNRRVRIDPLPTPLFKRLRVEGMRVGDGHLDFTIEHDGSTPRVKVDRIPKGVRLELPA